MGLKGRELSEVAPLHVTLGGLVLRMAPPARVCDQAWETSPMP